ncbi:MULTISPECIES: ABC transporter permease [Streptomyces]|uniref:Transport permease protein n=1 Tax=Streptomyces tsukubensis (strain DSM 42081 / NBRC 108919 / NRRL 18488 / 9993) TaxID=1114943 RepID=I2N0J0_STRT9|nr:MULTISPECIES: ABC transporter permease [Streptomyces]AZK94736.1 multidrug ABC transporter permease [Streptomyces tsukubensis]EIF90537.1 ABC transporter [Streptomyces tsukubensis NRRL18488]MYS63859.1 ABC transporter permease [Streptomyces sp. SID5473]QKM69182.1 ABC transporter permease [Streptomyces tsukubensis NRRL18488]TAI42888.1 ABC transporter permease [Streptomyces tsukubensis]
MSDTAVRDVSTREQTPAPAGPGPVVLTVHADGRERRLYWAVADCWNVVRRGLTHYQRQPINIVWQLGFPILSVLLYAYVFGGAMKSPGGDYRDYLMPGMFVMTMAFGFMGTAMTVVADSTKGVIDRFRSMPMAPSAVVSGRGVTDILVAVAELAILAVTAVLIGWRSDGGFFGTLGAFGLLVLLRFSLIWIGVWLGLIVPNAEAAGGLYAVAFPLTMVSSIFVPTSSMPDWLGTVAAWNPISSTAGATRELFGNPVASDGSWIQENAVLMAVAWPLVLTAIFLPLAVRRFQKLSR